VVLADSRDFRATPEGLLHALGGSDLGEVLAGLNATRPLIMLDTFEGLGDLTRYLQEELVPGLDTAVKVVIAGRFPGVLARGGLYLCSSPFPHYKRIMEAMGFERLPTARDWFYGREHPVDGYVLDLTRTGVDAWIEGLIGGRRPATAKPLAGGDDTPLTPREREVAALIAQGLSNRQVAEALVITELTAETHVRNILGKLGVRSRARVAVWAAEQGLLARGPG
jgi:DNA-binding CsgD family transcriptional regulator